MRALLPCRLFCFLHSHHPREILHSSISTAPSHPLPPSHPHSVVPSRLQELISQSALLWPRGFCFNYPQRVNLDHGIRGRLDQHHFQIGLSIICRASIRAGDAVVVRPDGKEPSLVRTEQVVSPRAPQPNRPKMSTSRRSCVSGPLRKPGWLLLGGAGAGAKSTKSLEPTTP